jgi:hypothetical protein
MAIDAPPLVQREIAPEPPRSGRRERRRGRWARRLLTFLVVLALLGAAAWWSWRQVAADDLATGWQLDCGDGAQVGSVDGVQAISGEAGWRCDVVVTVHNDSWHSVRVTGAEAGFLGPDGGGETRALPGTDGVVGEPVGASPTDDLTAHWPVDLTVAARSSEVLRLPIGWREAGCDGAGLVTLGRFPTLLVESLGRVVPVRSGQDLHVQTYDDAHDATACGS